MTPPEQYESVHPFGNDCTLSEKERQQARDQINGFWSWYTRSRPSPSPDVFSIDDLMKQIRKTSEHMWCVARIKEISDAVVVLRQQQEHL